MTRPRTSPALPALLALAAALTVPTSAAGQEPEPPPPANPADVASVDAIVAAVYDVISGEAGAARDWDRFRSLFASRAHLIPTGPAQGGGFGRLFMSPDEYVRRNGAALRQNGFFEREIFRVEERFGPLVHLFSTYESRRAASDPEPFARGVNSFQLHFDGSRWWIVNISWFAETAEHPIPARYLPGG